MSEGAERTPREAFVTWHMSVDLADERDYPEGLSLIECAQLDFEADPVAFFADQCNILAMEPMEQNLAAGSTEQSPREPARYFPRDYPTEQLHPDPQWVLDELKERLLRAHRTLLAEADSSGSRSRSRHLRTKAEGVGIALGYLTEMMRA